MPVLPDPGHGEHPVADYGSYSSTHEPLPAPDKPLPSKTNNVETVLDSLDDPPSMVDTRTGEIVPFGGQTNKGGIAPFPL